MNLKTWVEPLILCLCECLWLPVAVPKCQEIADIEHL